MDSSQGSFPTVDSIDIEPQVPMETSEQPKQDDEHLTTTVTPAGPSDNSTVAVSTKSPSKVRVVQTKVTKTIRILNADGTYSQAILVNGPQMHMAGGAVGTNALPANIPVIGSPNQTGYARVMPVIIQSNKPHIPRFPSINPPVKRYVNKRKKNLKVRLSTKALEDERKKAIRHKHYAKLSDKEREVLLKRKVFIPKPRRTGYCSAANCTKDTTTDSNVKLLGPPKIPHILLQWLELSGRIEVMADEINHIRSTFALCNAHFTDDDYETVAGLHGKRLKPEAVPTQWPEGAPSATEEQQKTRGQAKQLAITLGTRDEHGNVVTLTGLTKKDRKDGENGWSSKSGGRYCSVVGCSNAEKKGYRMFRFPRGSRTDHIVSLWMKFTRRADLTPDNLRSRSICSDHFKSTDAVKCPNSGRMRLKKFVIPSIMHGNIVHQPSTINPLAKSKSNGDDATLNYADRKLNFLKRCKQADRNFVEEELRDRLAIEKHKIRILQAQMKEMERKHSNPDNSKEVVDKYLRDVLPEGLYKFISSQIEHATGDRIPWTAEERMVARAMFSCGKKKYAFLRKILNLPDERTIRRWNALQRKELLDEADREMCSIEIDQSNTAERHDINSQEEDGAIASILQEIAAGTSSNAHQVQQQQQPYYTTDQVSVTVSNAHQVHQINPQQQQPIVIDFSTLQA